MSPVPINYSETFQGAAFAKKLVVKSEDKKEIPTTSKTYILKLMFLKLMFLKLMFLKLIYFKSDSDYKSV
jgi:hypothetical protein